MSAFVCRAELIGVFQEDLDRLDRHRAVGVDGDTRNLLSLHQFLEHEQQLLGAFDGECRDHDAASALHGGADQGGQFRLGVVMRMLAIAVRALHDEVVAALVLGGSRVQNAPGRDFAVAHASDVSGEEQARGLPCGRQT